jgi:hypothetical protein
MSEMKTSDIEQQESKSTILTEEFALAQLNDGLQSKTFTWNEIRAGDCHEVSGTVLLVSDGRGKFTCTTWTDHTHSGDVWHASFTVLDRFGLTLFQFGGFDSPRMNDGGPRYPWEADFNYPAQHFDAAVSITQYSSC